MSPSFDKPKALFGTRTTLFLLLAIMVLAGLLRLARLDMAEFKADEAGIARQAMALLHEGRFPVVGPQSSQGPAHPPLQIYLMALPFAITPDPRLAVAVIALIHTAAVALAFVIGSRFFHPRVGLVAAFLFAVNPWAIYYARKMWTQNWPLATTLFILGLLLVVVEGRRWALIGAALALAAVVGTHLGGLALLVLMVLVLALFFSRRLLRPIGVSALMLGVLALPYLYHDATHGWSNLRRLVDLGGAGAKVDGQALRFAAWLASGYHYEDLAGSSYQAFLAGLPGLHWLDVLEMGLLGLGVVYLTLRVVRQIVGKQPGWRGPVARDLVLLGWLALPVLLQTRHSQPVYPHYFILLYPVQFLIVAILLHEGLTWLHRRGGAGVWRWSATAALGGILLIGGWQVYLGQAFIRFAAHNPTPGGYGPVIGPLWQTASTAGQTARRAGAEVLVVAEGDDPVWDNVPATMDVLLPRDLARRFVVAGQALVFPSNPAVTVVAPQAGAAAAALQAQPGTQAVSAIEVPGGGRFDLFMRDNASRDDVLEGMIALEPAPQLANGVRFLAYQVDALPARESGGTLALSLAWWYDHPSAPEANYHSFAHLVDGDGKRWGQHDLSGFATRFWRPGDVVLTRFRIDVPPGMPAGSYWVRLGMYSYPDVVNVPVLDAAGNPASDAVVAGPFVLK